MTSSSSYKHRTTEPDPERLHRARVAIDLGAESCRVSLLRWSEGRPQIELIHRIANGPVHSGSSLRWPLATILAGLEEGLRRAADVAPEGIASIAVDGWAVDYVRLDGAGRPLSDPFCYRDERTTAAKQAADTLIDSQDIFARAGAQPLRINTLYQLLADPASGIDPHAPWICLPEYVLHWLGGRRVAEYTNATHTGLVDLATGDWSPQLFQLFGIPIETAPPIVSAGTVLGRVSGALAELPAFSETQLIAPACHDTASAIAAVAGPLDAAAYISCGTWSLIGTLVAQPITTHEALGARYTNQGAAAGGFCFHTNVNGLWLLQQCQRAWAEQGRPQGIDDLIRRASVCEVAGTIDVDAEPLLLDTDMPERINHELARRGHRPIPDIRGNEPLFARVIFESLACRYASAISQLESILGRRLERIHVLGGGGRNNLLLSLTARGTGLPVQPGHPESSTIGNLAIQLASSESPGGPLNLAALHRWATRLQ